MSEDENIFNKYMTTCENVSKLIKANFNSELIYNKFHLKAGKNSTQKKLSMFICTSNID